MPVPYALLGSARDYLLIASSTQKIEICLPWIYYLQRSGRRTLIVGWKMTYLVDSALETLAALLPASDFVQVNDDCVAGREHVSSFADGVARVGNDFIDVDPSFNISDADFPWVSCRELVLQRAWKDASINSKPELN